MVRSFLRYSHAIPIRKITNRASADTPIQENPSRCSARAANASAYACNSFCTVPSSRIGRLPDAIETAAPVSFATRFMSRQNSIQLPPLTAGSAVMQSSCRISFFLSAAPCSRQNQTKTRANAAHKNPTDFTSTRTPRYRAIRRLEKAREREAASAMSAVAVSAAAVSAPGTARSSRQLISITP